MMKPMNRRLALQRASATLAALAVGDVALAQTDTWPARPITMIVPASAGSGTDLLAREVAQRLSLALKQPVLVDNKPGASGVVGTQMVVRAAPDGYTLLYTNGSFSVMAPALVKSMPYDVQKDLVPVAQSVTGGVMLMVHPDFPAKNLQELVQVVKANPNKFTYGTWGIGSSGHLMMEWLKNQSGMQITHVPYRQTPTLLTELSTGVLKIGWSDPAAPIPFIDSGKVRAIAVSGTVRLPRTPNIPTMGEQGYDFQSVGWFGVFAPTNTPRAIVQRLSDEVNRIHEMAEMGAKMTALNVSPPKAKTPEQFGTIIANDLQTWRKIVSDAKITVE
jgi:tripartite-type tricarboxylate transporter receptor subunit TctC